MKKFLPLTIVIFIACLEVKADCNPAFTVVSINQATVQVQAANTAPGLAHFWRFSSNAWAPGWHSPTASYTYPAPGTYTIMHRVVDTLGLCEDSAYQTVTVNFPVNCTASFTITRDSVQPYLYSIHSTSVYSGGAISQCTWTLDGVTLPQHGPSFSYTLNPGLYNICLTIATTAGCTSTLCDTIVVNPPVCTLTAAFTYTTSPSNPGQFSFAGSPSSGSFAYNWNFGDGQTSSQQNPTHTYAQAGVYNVVFRIWDPVHSCFDTTIQSITVHGLPSDSCTVTYTRTANPSHPNQFHFTAISNQTITSQVWWINDVFDPHDSLFINSNNPTYTFTDSGYYQVCLYITTNTGCTGSYCDSIYISNIGGRTARTIPSFPNPAVSTVNLRLSLPEARKIGITVYNLSGYAVHQSQKQGVVGTNEIAIPIQQLNSGQYFIDIKYGGQQKRSMFQKL